MVDLSLQSGALEPALAAPDPFVRTLDDKTEALDLLISGATCAACIQTIEGTMRAVPGMVSARLNLTTGRLALVWKTGQVDPQTVISKVKAQGYGAVPFDPAEAKGEGDKEGRRLAIALGVAGFGVMNVMMFTVPVWSGLVEMGVETRTLMYWWAAVISTPCTLWAGMPFYTSAWRALRAGRANMDVPISLGVLLTLGISFSETLLQGEHTYFDAAISLLFLLLIGRFLDHQLRMKAKTAARDLLALQTPTAQVSQPDGRFVATKVRDVRVGDLLLIPAGERVPVDVVVVAGASDLDVALITGETKPAQAGPGSHLFAGTLNLTGALTARAMSAAEDSSLAELARLMEAGSQARSKYVVWADKAAALYVPVVHTLAAAAFLGWILFGLDVREALLRAVAVLIITCPCALGLAVPAVQITASGRLFRKGVLVKSGAALERLAEIDRVVFDKTGVLTRGEPVLVAQDPDLIAKIAPLARASSHPLARAVAKQAGEGGLAEQVVETAGFGIEGILDGRRARLGRAGFVVEGMSPGTGTELWFAFLDQPDQARCLCFEDQIRSEARETVAALRARGLGVEILSGDVPEAVKTVADALGVDVFAGGLTPRGKVERLEALADQGHKVLMVGDGLNDAAALARASASMAPGQASQATQSAADLVYEVPDLRSVTLAIDISRAAKKRAMENFALSALYNLIATPAAVFGLITPFIAAIAMSVSSLVVTLNALRLHLEGKSPWMR